jgi:hypothetical protein
VWLFFVWVNKYFCLSFVCLSPACLSCFVCLSVLFSVISIPVVVCRGEVVYMVGFGGASVKNISGCDCCAYRCFLAWFCGPAFMMSRVLLFGKNNPAFDRTCTIYH